MTAVTAAPMDLDGFTLADLDALPDDELRYELDDGCLVVSPPEVVRNGSAAFQLGLLLAAELDDRWRVVPTPGIAFGQRDYREPDLVVLRRDALHKTMVVPADVLLVVEVMSPSSVRRDRLVKPVQYATAGIAHYWRLEPTDRVLVTHALDGDAYRETGRFTDEVEIQDPVHLRFALTRLLD